MVEKLIERFWVNLLFPVALASTAAFAFATYEAFQGRLGVWLIGLFPLGVATGMWLWKHTMDGGSQ